MLQTTDAQAPRRGRRQRAEAAIAHALGRRWEQAAAENRALLEEDASDIEAANRLGKALTELDDLAGAEQAYLAALTIDGANAIARRNLGRIQEALAGAQRKPAKAKAARGAAAKKGARGGGKAAAAARPAAATVSIIEATGASAEFALQRPVLAALQRLEPGDTLELAATESGVAVTTERGVVLGQIEPRAGLRLRRMIEGGNRYTVILRQITEGGATVHVRESHRDPSLVGQVSFLPPPATRRRAPRAYSRPSAVVRYDADPDDDDDEEENDVWRPRAGGAAKAQDELAAGGFSEERAGDDADEADDDDEDEDDTPPAGVLDDEPANEGDDDLDD